VMFGSPETTSGGNALKFYASQRLDIRRIGAIKIGDEIIGNETKVKVVKNKVASPFKETTFRIMYGKGIDTTGEILDFSVAENFIKKSGAWYSYGEERIGQGRQNAIDWLEENQQIAKELEKIISEKKGFISARQIQQPDTRRDTEETGSIG
jgi:recombination protein RecA